MNVVRRVLLLAIISMLAPGVSACGTSGGYEKLIEQLIDLQNEQADILNGINTLEDIEKAKPALVRIMKKARVVATKLEPFKDRMNKDELFKSKLGQRLNEAQMRMQEALGNLETRLDPATMQALIKVMEEAAQ
ncbi:MAG: hypothetical protein Kow00133_12490 [Amphiplicatus sp.]